MLSPRRFFARTFALGVLLALSLRATPSEEQLERTTAAHLIAFGRAPTAIAAPTSTLAEQVAQQRTELKSDASLRERTARAAWRDAWGEEPSRESLRQETATAHTYAERLQRHLARQADSPNETRAMIHRAYRLAVHREAYDEEFAYWQPHGPLTFVALVACLEDWARRNQPGLMVTAGAPTVPVRSKFVRLLPLSPAIAAEMRAALSLAETNRVIAFVAAELAAPGKMHLALVGVD